MTVAYKAVTGAYGILALDDGTFDPVWRLEMDGEVTMQSLSFDMPMRSAESAEGFVWGYLCGVEANR